jgi:DNA-binding GntR family transcriptional regulator
MTKLDKRETMNCDLLLEAAKNTCISEKDIAALKERLAAAEKQFEDDARDRAIDAEFLNRTYTL